MAESYPNFNCFRSCFPWSGVRSLTLCLIVSGGTCAFAASVPLTNNDPAGATSFHSAGRFLGRIGNNVPGNTTVGTSTANSLSLNGGRFDQAGAKSDNSVLMVAGNVTVNAASSRWDPTVIASLS